MTHEPVERDDEPTWEVLPRTPEPRPEADDSGRLARSDGYEPPRSTQGPLETTVYLPRIFWIAALVGLIFSAMSAYVVIDDPHLVPIVIALLCVGATTALCYRLLQPVRLRVDGDGMVLTYPPRNVVEHRWRDVDSVEFVGRDEGDRKGPVVAWLIVAQGGRTHETRVGAYDPTALERLLRRRARRSRLRQVSRGEPLRG